jgi:hypothetical protein
MKNMLSYGKLKHIGNTKTEVLSWIKATIKHLSYSDDTDYAAHYIQFWIAVIGGYFVGYFC